MWHPLADKFTYSHHLSVWQCIGYYKEKFYASHFGKWNTFKFPPFFCRSNKWKVCETREASVAALKGEREGRERGEFPLFLALPGPSPLTLSCLAGCEKSHVLSIHTGNPKCPALLPRGISLKQLMCSLFLSFDLEQFFHFAKCTLAVVLFHLVSCRFIPFNFCSTKFDYLGNLNRDHGGLSQDLTRAECCT